MKRMIGSIIAILAGLGLITGALFYIIPKFIQKKSTGYTNFIDNVCSWVATNWIWCIVIVAALMFVLIVIYIAMNINKNR